MMIFSDSTGLSTHGVLQLHPVGPVIGGMVVHPMARCKEVMRFYHEYASAAPDELTTVAALMTSPDGDPVVGIAVCYCGTLEEGERVLKPLKSFGPPLADLIQPMPYLDVQRLLAGAFPIGPRYYWKTSLLRDLTDAAIETIEAHASVKPTALSAIAFQQLHGAASRVGVTETAFAHRYDHYNFIPVAIWEDANEDTKSVQWVRALWEAMQPYLERDAYLNDMGDEDKERVRAAYGANYERLSTLKNKYDPSNFFRLNWNV